MAIQPWVATAEKGDILQCLIVHNMKAEWKSFAGHAEERTVSLSTLMGNRSISS